MAIDERLLNKSGAAKAGELNEARRSDGTIGNQDAQNAAATWEDATAARRKQSAVNGAAARVGAAIASPISKSTGKLLQQSWLNLVDSFGLTLIWINIHVFLGMILGNKLFCKLGEEWESDAMTSSASGGAANFSESLPGAKKLTGTTEGMGLACCDLGCLFILIAVAVTADIIFQILSGDWKTIKTLFSVVWDVFKGFVGL